MLHHFCSNTTYDNEKTCPLSHTITQTTKLSVYLGNNTNISNIKIGVENRHFPHLPVENRHLLLLQKTGPNFTKTEIYEPQKTSLGESRTDINLIFLTCIPSAILYLQIFTERISSS